jgi:hypothetical protein
LGGDIEATITEPQGSRLPRTARTAMTRRCIVARRECSRTWRRGVKAPLSAIDRRGSATRRPP